MSRPNPLVCRREWEKRIRIQKEKREGLWKNNNKWHKFVDKQLVNFTLEYREKVVFI